MLSIIIPALNEEHSIEQTIGDIQKSLKNAEIPYEIIVINDGSTDETGRISEELKAKVVHHPVPGGYGHAIKVGIDLATFDIIAITDADGTYPVDFLPELFNHVFKGNFDMAVGARTGSEYQGNFLKKPARKIFKWLCEYATGREIPDINSGLRVFRKEIPQKYRHTISNGFSFTTTITLAAMLNGYFVTYIPVPYFKRSGCSHVHYYRDTLRSLQIIVENILYYNPLKLFLLIVNFLFSLSFFSAIMSIFGNSHADRRLSSVFSMLCFVSSFIIGSIGLATDLIRMSIKEIRS